jgi:hypothetical protein
MHKRAILIGLTFVGLAVLLIVLLILSAAPRHPATRPAVSVTHVGYTNDVAGARLAAFIVSNASPFPVTRRAGYWIEAPTTSPPHATNIQWRVSRGGHHVRLSPGAAETLLVAPPSNQPTWRVSLWIGGGENLMKRVIRESVDDVGLPGLRPQMTRVVHSFHSEWVTP